MPFDTQDFERFLRSMEMYTERGNEAVEALVISVATGVGAGAMNRVKAVKALQEGTAKIAVTHGEIRDTVVRESISFALHETFATAGFRALGIDEF